MCYYCHYVGFNPRAPAHATRNCWNPQTQWTWNTHSQWFQPIRALRIAKNMQRIFRMGRIRLALRCHLTLQLTFAQQVPHRSVAHVQVTYRRLTPDVLHIIQAYLVRLDLRVP